MVRTSAIPTKAACQAFISAPMLATKRNLTISHLGGSGIPIMKEPQRVSVVDGALRIDLAGRPERHRGRPFRGAGGRGRIALHRGQVGARHERAKKRSEERPKAATT